jgi:3-methyladenine DNA glycosylase AlkD
MVCHQRRPAFDRLIMPALNDIIKQLQAVGSEANRKGMQRYGIAVDKAFGVPLPFLRNLAKEYRPNHNLAVQLWRSGFHEARMLASMVDDPAKVTESQMEEWVHEFNSWDVCDQCCSNLFDKTPFALQKIYEWTDNEHEFVRRAGFVLIACLAVHDKKREDTSFKELLPLIIEHSTDPRNFVRKAVNWALRQIGKRNLALYA